MLSKIGRIIFFILIISGLAIIQISLISAWPGIFKQINLGLIFLIFTLFFFGYRPALWFALILGFCLDLFSFKFFGLYLISLSLTVLGTQLILKNWLTNRSLYSFLLLILLATISYNLLIIILFSATLADQSLIFLGQKSLWLNLVYQSAWSLAAAILLFNLVASLTKKLQPVFLEKKLIS